MTPAGFATLAALLKQRSGLSIGPDKLYLLERRLAPILRRDGLRDLDELADRLRRLPNEALACDVTDAMTINETLFFRDQAPFEQLRDHVLPALHASRPSGASLRIWSAAAAGGQEAYSIAMTVAESRARLKRRQVEIVATDIAQSQVERAQEGSYTSFEMQRGLSPELRERYFERDGRNWRVVNALRDCVQFRRWNLLDDPTPLGTFDVVFCRNVLIYFDEPTKTRVLAGLRRVIAPDGIIYLGGAETVVGLFSGFIPAPGRIGFVPAPSGGGGTMPARIASVPGVRAGKVGCLQA